MCECMYSHIPAHVNVHTAYAASTLVRTVTACVIHVLNVHISVVCVCVYVSRGGGR